MGTMCVFALSVVPLGSSTCSHSQTKCKFGELRAQNFLSEATVGGIWVSAFTLWHFKIKKIHFQLVWGVRCSRLQAAAPPSTQRRILQYLSSILTGFCRMNMLSK